MASPRALVLTFVFISAAASAQTLEPRAAVVLVQGKGLGPKEVDALLDGAKDELKNLSAYRLDPASSLEADNEASMNGCSLEYDCLLRVAQAVGVDAVLAIRAQPDSRKSLTLELLWVAADAKGLPGDNERAVQRTPQALEAGIRHSLKRVLPGYAMKGRGGVDVLAESGSEISVDGEKKGVAPLSAPIVLGAGPHQVEVLTPTKERVTQSVDVPEGRKVLVDMPSPHAAVVAITRVDEAPANGQSLKVASYVVGGAAALALVVGVVFGAQTLGTNGQLRSGVCKDTPCSAAGTLTQVQAQNLYEHANGTATVANISLATGVFLAAGSGALFYLGSREEKAAPKTDAEPQSTDAQNTEQESAQ